jgi:23S rRNA (adenine1618-N6)-methyltransferase
VKKKPTGFHPNNLHQGRYDLNALSETLPELKQFLVTKFESLTVDFANPLAVKTLNRALLKHFYGVENWDVPEGYLCPPVPGRADYIHHLADLLTQSNEGRLPKSRIDVLDIGTGANLIYPLLGASIYGWRFVGSELNPKALGAAQSILDANPKFQPKIELRAQTSSEAIFAGIIQKEEFLDLTICNPPFHESAEAAQEGSKRKVRNLTGKPVSKAELNFGGQAAELWTEGGEFEFIRKMVLESLKFKSQVYLFTTLVSKSEHLKGIETTLKNVGVIEHRVVSMAQGNKQSRFIAWTFLNRKQQQAWRKFRWSK